MGDLSDHNDIARFMRSKEGEAHLASLREMLVGKTIVDVEFSNDNQANWDYIPLDIGDGTDPAVTDIRVSLSGTMVGSVGAGNPSFQVYFKVVVQ